MTQRPDISQYFTKSQSDARYLFRPAPALPPVSAVFTSTGLSVTTDPSQFAYVNITIVDPVTPTGFTGLQYVQSYQFTCTGTLPDTSTITTIITLPWDMSGVYQVQPLITGINYSIVVDTIDYQEELDTVGLTIIGMTAVDSTPPTPPVIVGNIVGLGLQITLDMLVTAADFDHYDVMRGNGFMGGTWNSGPGRIASLVNADIPTEVFVDHAIPLTAPDYYYFLRCWDISGNFADTNIIGPFSLTTTTDPPPIQPDMTTAVGTSNTDGSITLVWTADTSDTSPNLAGYRIYRKLHSNTFFQLVGIVAASPQPPSSGNTAVFTDDRTSNGYTYDYTVSAFDTFGSESTYDTINLVTVLSVNSFVPGIVTNLSFNGVLGGISVVWTVGAGDTSYGLSWRYAQVGDLSLTTWTPELVVQGNSFVIYGLLYPTTGIPPTRLQLANEFEVRIQSFSSIGTVSAFSSRIVTFPDLTGYQPADLSIPPAPITVGDVINNDGTIRLVWTAPSIPDVAGYQIEKLENETLPWNLLALLQDSSAGTKFFLATGLEPFQFSNKQYRFRIRTKDNSGNLSNYNYVLNPGFETGALSPWSHGGSGVHTVINTNTFASSSFALKQDDTGHVWQTIPVSAGSIYTLSAYVVQDPSDPGTYTSVHIKWLDVSNATLGDVWSVNSPASGSYIRRTVTGTAPTNAVNAVIELRCDQLHPNNTAIWDAIQFEEDVTATSYADGKTGILNAVDTTGPSDYFVAGPSDPLKLVATGALGQIGLTWFNPPSSFSGYYDYINGVFEIWRKVTVSTQPSLPVTGSYMKIAEVPAAADAAMNGFSDLQPDEAFNITASYQLRARDRFGNEGPVLNGGAAVSSMSKTPNDILIVTVDTVPPNQPDMTTATILVQDDGSIKLTWHNQTTIDLAGYTIFRRRSGVGETFLPVANLNIGPGSGTLSFVDSNPVLLQTYDYTIAAFDRQQNLSTFDTVHFLTAQSADTRTPSTPTNLAAKGQVAGILNSWTPSATIGVKDYGFQYSLNNGTTWSTLIIVTGTSYVQSFTNAESLASYLFRVEADSSSHSAMSSFATLNPTNRDLSTYVPVDTTAPNPVTGFTATAVNNGDVVLAWTASTSPDVDHYFIESQYDTTGTWRAVGTIPPTSTTFRATGLALFANTGIGYFFRITTYDHTGLTSSPVTDGPVNPFIIAAPPAVPTGLAVTLTNNTTDSYATCNLTWTPNTEADLAGYTVMLRLSDMSDYPSTFVIGPTTALFVIHSFQQGVSYDFSVSAFNTSAQASVFSSIVSATSAGGGGGPAPPPTPLCRTRSEVYLDTTTYTDVFIDTSGYSIGTISGTLVGIIVYARTGTGSLGLTDPWGVGNPTSGDIIHTFTTPGVITFTPTFTGGTWYAFRVHGSLSSPNDFSAYSTHARVIVPTGGGGGGPP